MKFLQRLVFSLALVAALVSCHGQTDDGEVSVTLVQTTNTIVADGVDKVGFSVLYGAADVTAEAQIYLTSHSELGWNGKEFTTTEAGEYTFQAIYRDQQSNAVTITAMPLDDPFESQFERHICVMDLTGTWCTFCPDGMTKLNFYVQKQEWKNIVHVLALHDNTQGDDPMGIALTSKVMADFGNYGYPMFVTDLRDSGSLNEHVKDIVPSFESSIEMYPAHCGVKISSSVEGTTANVTVDLFAESDDKYALTVFLLEDGIVAPQKDGSITHEDYKHKHVVRAMLNANYKGESLGSLKAGSETSKSYSYTLAEEWKVENMSVVVLAIDGSGYVNNVAECALGEECDYNYVTE